MDIFIIVVVIVGLLLFTIQDHKESPQGATYKYMRVSATERAHRYYVAMVDCYSLNYGDKI